MVERVETGGLMSFNYNRLSKREMSDKEKKEIAKGYEEYYERRKREKRKKFIFILLIIAIIVAGILGFIFT